MLKLLRAASIRNVLTAIAVFSACAVAQITPPRPVLPVPSNAQLAWQKLEYYAFVHFGMNTFTDHEWGEGRAPATDFNPTAFDADQWARVVREAGMKGIIVTAKHHDGFCLWPSKTTEYSVKNSNWRGGRGDVLKDLSAACKKYGLKFGVYISPWDRNHPLYGKPEYNEVYKAQWRELLTNYGDVFETWLDGANDGKKPMTYDFDGFFKTILTTQPQAVIFSDAGPGARWVGNERGFAGETNWSTRDNTGVLPGKADEKALNVGDENGASWIPAECDVSIRPGWFYHANEDSKLKSVSELMDIWYGSVGRNCNLLLNIGVDRRGLVNENDIARLIEFRKAREFAFGENLAKGIIRASNFRGKDKRFGPGNLLDNDFETYFATDDDESNVTIELEFKRATEFDAVELQEYIALGQRVKKFSVGIEKDGSFIKIAGATTIGYKRIVRFPKVKTNRLRIVIDDAKAGPVLSSLAVYNTKKS